ncbi:DgyrCDS12044 [Dimorphilus gyrociliatus]|uniref:DgyrCDS12044 n=1 Tax=Dimorphilus gyrociliatus TaxID=2664684 RepID=A0A7I8W592_9ANNE|nr:DgyrCDS12044 [Dimorphilus gyrociliatus]
METSFVDMVKEVLSEELKRNDKFLPTEDINELLSEEFSEETTRSGIFGYPTRPLYKTIGVMLDRWIQNKESPVMELPNYDLLDEKEYLEERSFNFKKITDLLDGIQTLWDHSSKAEQNFSVRKMLMILGKRGILDLLGVRKTVGSKDIFPPPRKLLEDTFQQLNNPGSILTVGARALAKHCHRDETDGWWGKCKGREIDKNEHAFKILGKILDNSTWINIHWLPHDVIICEVRQENGYGARWTHDGKSFRGFLEPQMAGGHDVGWKH